MSFAIPFSKTFKYPQQDIQWNIIYKPKIKELSNFIEYFPNHRINLIIKDKYQKERDTRIIKTLNEKFTNIVVCFPKYLEDMEQHFVNNNIKYYYNELITNWDKFYGFLSLGVTDIFLAEDIMFDLTNVRTKANEYNKLLRSFCNVCQSSWEKTPAHKTFFIRPEDLDIYSNFIDTFEFFVQDNKKINTLYTIYTKDKKWYGNLKEIIVGYNQNDDNKYIIPPFGEKRINCNKKCLKKSEPTCHICDNIISLNKTLKEKSIIIQKERNSTQNGEKG